jgi:PEP-CTERM motif
MKHSLALVLSFGSILLAAPSFAQVAAVYDAITGASLSIPTNISVNIQLYNTPAFTASGSGAAFSNPIGGLRTFTAGAQTLAANTAYLFTLTFGTPISFTGNQLGVAINWQGNTGSGLANTDNLSTAVRIGAPAVGTTPGYYYRNASGQTNMNFLGSDARQIGADSSLAIRVFVSTLAPEPGTLALLLAGSGALGMVVRRRRTA